MKKAACIALGWFAIGSLVSAQSIQLEEQGPIVGPFMVGNTEGSTVAVTESTLVVGNSGADVTVPQLGEQGAAGTVRVYDRIGGEWVFLELLQSDAPTLNGRFGHDVAAEEERLIVSEPNATTVVPGDGEVAVFERAPGGSWTRDAILRSSDPGQLDRFGWSISLGGDQVLVGGPWDDDLGAQSGSAYVFERSGTLWTQVAKLLPSDGDAGDEFGREVCIASGLAVVGAPENNDFGTESGAAYVYREVAGQWTQVQKLLPSNIGNLFRFGTSISVIDGQILVGSPTASFFGAVYFFVPSGNTWVEQQILTAPTVPSGFLVSRFGESVAAHEGRAVVGAPKTFIAGFSGNGTAHTFTRSAGVWTLESTLFPSLLSNGQCFGAAVDVSSTSTIAGVYSYRSDDFVTLFCFGDGSSVNDPTGCGRCPCNNDAPMDTIGGCRNSSARSATLRGFRSPSVSDDELEFRLNGGTANSFAVLVSGENRLPNMGPCQPGDGIFNPNAPLDGLRCVGGATFLRHGTRAIDENGANPIAWGAAGSSSGPIASTSGFTAGQVRHFQVFYRENEAVLCMHGIATSNGATIVFQP